MRARAWPSSALSLSGRYLRHLAFEAVAGLLEMCRPPKKIKISSGFFAFITWPFPVMSATAEDYQLPSPSPSRPALPSSKMLAGKIEWQRREIRSSKFRALDFRCDRMGGVSLKRSPSCPWPTSYVSIQDMQFLRRLNGNP